MTVPFAACACKGGTYKCAFSDSCLLPVCLFKNWDKLIGATCADATKEIQTDYPGMKINCTTAKPVLDDANFDTNRVFIVVDVNQVVVSGPTVG
jgi:Potato inhibitor I family